MADKYTLFVRVGFPKICICLIETQSRYTQVSTPELGPSKLYRNKAILATAKTVIWRQWQRPLYGDNGKDRYVTTELTI